MSTWLEGNHFWFLCRVSSAGLLALITLQDYTTLLLTITTFLRFPQEKTRNCKFRMLARKESEVLVLVFE